MSQARLTRTLLQAVFVELVLCVGLTAYATMHKLHLQHPVVHTAHVSSTFRAQTASMPETVNAGVPARLKIPKIQVDAALEQVGLTPQGDLDTPKIPGDAAWYNQSPRPGDSGNAIIDGHYGYKNRLPAAFDNLHLLQAGDSIYTVDANGTTTAFVVRTTQTLSPNQDAAAVFHPSDGGEHLNLITCQGKWNESQKSYATRLVVFADKQTHPSLAFP